MTAGSISYTLAGFSPELDWRPLSFVKPIPLHRVCEACRLVRHRTAVLPCRHTLRESCYELSTRDNRRVCPLDGHEFEEEDVDRKEFPIEELLRRQVRCWNEGNDCMAVMPASQIAHHFQRECRHHSIPCPRCSAAVLCADVCAHLESGCSTATRPAESECQGYSSGTNETALLTAFRVILQEQAYEIKALLQRRFSGTDASSDRLNELAHGINKCQETLREDLRQGIGCVKETVRQEATQARTEHRDFVTKCSDEIAVFRQETKGHFIAASDTMNEISNCIHAVEKLVRDNFSNIAKEKRDTGSLTVGGSEEITEQVEDSGNALTVMNMMPRPLDLKLSVCKFVVKDFISLVEKAWSGCAAEYVSERVYLRGYCMSPGVFFSVRGAWLHAFFHLYKGVMDDIVQWPFEQTIKFSVVHRSGQEKQVQERPSHSLVSRKRPPVPKPYSCNARLFLDDIIRGGYVDDGQLRVKFELLP